MKRVAALLLAFALLFAFSVVAFANEMPAELTRYVYTENGKGLNCRSSPQTNIDNVIAKIPYGTEVYIFETYDHTWTYIMWNNVEGYVMTRFLRSSPPSPKPQPIPTKVPAPSGEINYTNFENTSYMVFVRPSTPSGFVHMRWAPSKATTIRKDYYANASLLVIAQNNTWAQVLDLQTNEVGFMMRQFIVAE